MGWVKLDQHFFTHPKALTAGRDARDLWLVALCWASAHQTDGVVPAAVLPLLGSLAGVVDIDVAASRLVDVGLWETHVDGWSVHDFLSHQTSRADRDLWKTRERERKQTARRAPKAALVREVSADCPRGFRALEVEVEVEEEVSQSRTPTPPVDNSAVRGRKRTTTTTPAVVTNALEQVATALAERYAADGDTAAYRATVIANGSDHVARLGELAAANPTAGADELAAMALAAREPKPAQTRSACAVCGASTHDASRCMLADPEEMP
jgi:hypothetical protein